jgi:hypothetical protein
MPGIRIEPPVVKTERAAMQAAARPLAKPGRF